MFNKFTLSLLGLVYMIYIFLVFGDFMPEYNQKIIYYITFIIGITSLFMAARVFLYKEFNIYERLLSSFVHLLNFYLSYQVFKELKDNKKLEEIREDHKLPLIFTLWIGLALVSNRELYKRLKSNLSLKKI